MYLCDLIISLIRDNFMVTISAILQLFSKYSKYVVDAYIRCFYKGWGEETIWWYLSWAWRKWELALWEKKWKRILFRVWAKPWSLINMEYLGPRVSGNNLILPLLQASNFLHVTLTLIRLKQKTIGKEASETDISEGSPQWCRAK